MTKYVYAFEEGGREQKYLLGGKGANLAEMTNLGLPVPPGFTISTDACNDYMKLVHRLPEGLMDEVAAAREALEAKIGKRLGDADDPLLVSVRSGAPFSMPGMMDTVLNLGLNDESVKGLAKQTSNERFAYDSYRRFVQMFGKIVLDVPGDLFEEALHDLVEQKGLARRHRAVGRRPRRPRRRRSRRSCGARSGVEFPHDPLVAAPLRDRSGVQVVERQARAATTAGSRASPTTSAPRSTCRRWCSATRATTPAPVSRSRATRRRARTRRTATS